MPEDLSTDLESLKEKDPETWDNLSHLKLEGWHHPHDQAMDYLQGCLQRACEAREYHWMVCLDPYKEGKHRAEITVVSESHISDEIFIHELAMEWGDTPAHALLRAYLAALE